MKTRWPLFLLFIALCLITGATVSCQAADKLELPDWQGDLRLEEADGFMERGQGEVFSIRQYVTDVLAGKSNFSFGEIWDHVRDQVSDQWDSQKHTLLRLLALSVFAGVFVRFAGTVGDGDLGETGFYVVFLLLTGIVTTAFFAAYEVTEGALAHLVDFMKALVPSFSLALCYGGGMQSSFVFYETMLIAMGLLEMFLKNILLPGVQIYFFLSVINQMAERRFSRMVDLIGSILRWSIKLLFGVMIGYQGIQGMLVPVMDRVRNNAVWQTAKGLPGVGNTVGSVVDTVLGSGVLIKSAVGVGGLIGILVLCIYPLVKLLLFTLLYRVGGAVVQPVSDRRIVMVLQSAASSGKILLGYMAASTLMFMLSIVIVLVSTNMVSG